MSHLERTGYPYDIAYMRWAGHGDNALPDPAICEFVKEWSQSHDWPRLVISTTSEAFRAFDRRYGDKLPRVRGDLDALLGRRGRLLGPGDGRQPRQLRPADAGRVAVGRAAAGQLSGRGFPPCVERSAALLRAHLGRVLFGQRAGPGRNPRAVGDQAILCRGCRPAVARPAFPGAGTRPTPGRQRDDRRVQHHLVAAHRPGEHPALPVGAAQPGAGRRGAPAPLATPQRRRTGRPGPGCPAPGREALHRGGRCAARGRHGQSQGEPDRERTPAGGARRSAHGRESSSSVQRESTRTWSTRPPAMR